jgi:SAM-dependent methyltransferase
MTKDLSRRVGRRVFGRDPAAYDAARFSYPDELYAILERRCGLGPGTRTFEIGPGTGKATRDLLRRGANPLRVIEPDPRLARYLVRSLGRRRDRVVVSAASFESVDLPPGSFDLGVSATSLHWMHEGPALRKVARLLRPGGWWAAWWNIHHDPDHPGPLCRALSPLYARVPGGPMTPRGRRPPPALDRLARARALARVGRFRRISSTVFRRSVILTTPAVVALYATFSEIASLSPAARRTFLEGLARISDEEFGGRVTIRLLTPLYTAQRV